MSGLRVGWRTATTYESEEEHRQRFQGPLEACGPCGLRLGGLGGVSGLGFRVLGLRFRDSGIGFRGRPVASSLPFSWFKVPFQE